MLRSCSNNVKSKPNFYFYILPSDKNRHWHWLHATRRAKQRLRFCTLRYLSVAVCKGNEFLQFEKNPIKHASNIHPDVFNSFYQTVTHGESHRTMYKEILLSMVTPFFGIWTSRQKSPKQAHVISTAHDPPPIPGNNSRKHVNPVVNN